MHGGAGPPLLLLHGYPQTHVMWHKVAPLLMRDFTVVATDLRGYGDSSKPDSGPDHAGYSKRAMAQDQVEATAYFWWYFLVQPAPLPETLIGNDLVAAELRTFFR
ncbi:MAG TPA: alpha/beta fold hydrolase [Vicinamibacterales bacterium]|nr:alpha/beta fold hydrolase [Vicinamibacterales bacterium]